MSEEAWEVFKIEDLVQKVAGAEPRFFEFLRSPSLSCGVYRMPAGARDMQAPHLEDEVYFVVSGRAKLKIDGAEREVTPGDILFVRATAEHSFFEIEEDLTVIATFGSVRPL